ncbi:MAG: alpha/beta hydrolase [Deltaproteobacteria bacterium]|nr:alpha/beta hydrolase [Deltaproteobacteria bacterium]
MIATAPAAAPFDPPGDRVAYADDGEPLRYLVRGEGPPLLILNGLVSTHHHWPFFVEHFRQRCEVLFWDYRGHGGAAPPQDRGSVSTEHFADDAHAVLVAAAAAPAIVCGLSFGVQVALEHYRRHPDDVRALVLICGTWGHPLDRLSTAPALRRGLAAGLRALGRFGPLARLGLLVARSGLPREIAYLLGGAHRELCPRAALDGLFDHVSRLDPGVFGEICASYFEHTARDVLPTIQVPTLVIAGDRDQFTPPALGEEMQRVIPTARLRVFPGHSHLVQLERPDAVHAAIDEFLDDFDLRRR